MLHRARRNVVREGLALKQNHIGDTERSRIGGRRNAHRTIATMADDPEPVTIDGVDVLLPYVYERHVEATLGKQPAEQAAHGAAADDDRLGIVVTHDRHA